jgi:hypothetical protein
MPSIEEVNAGEKATTRGSLGDRSNEEAVEH